MSVFQGSHPQLSCPQLIIMVPLFSRLHSLNTFLKLQSMMLASQVLHFMFFHLFCCLSLLGCLVSHHSCLTSSRKFLEISLPVCFAHYAFPYSKRVTGLQTKIPLLLLFKSIHTIMDTLLDSMFWYQIVIIENKWKCCDEQGNGSICWFHFLHKDNRSGIAWSNCTCFGDPEELFSIRAMLVCIPRTKQEVSFTSSEALLLVSFVWLIINLTGVESHLTWSLSAFP